MTRYSVISISNGNATIDHRIASMISRKRRIDEYRGMVSETDLVLGSISESLVPDKALERMISSVNVHDVRTKEIRTSNVATFNSNREHRKAAKGAATIRKVIANSRHSIIDAEHVSRSERNEESI